VNVLNVVPVHPGCPGQNPEPLNGCACRPMCVCSGCNVVLRPVLDNGGAVSIARLGYTSRSSKEYWGQSMRYTIAFFT